MPLLVLLLVALVSLRPSHSWPGTTHADGVTDAQPCGREGSGPRVGTTAGSAGPSRAGSIRGCHGLALTVALGVVAVGGFVIGTLAYLVHTNSRLVDLDASVAQWGADHAGPESERWLTLITQLGATWLVVVLAFVVAVVGYLRRPNRWIPVFLLTVLVGQWLLANGIKDLLDRVRPTLNPITETLGPSFPSGHATAAAAFYAAAALVLGRGVGKHGRALLAGAAAGSPSPWRAPASSSTCTGSRTPARGFSRLGLVRGLLHRVRRTSLPPIGRCGRGGHARGGRGAT